MIITILTLTNTTDTISDEHDNCAKHDDSNSNSNNNSNNISNSNNNDDDNNDAAAATTTTTTTTDIDNSNNANINNNTNHYSNENNSDNDNDNGNTNLRGAWYGDRFSDTPLGCGLALWTLVGQGRLSGVSANGVTASLVFFDGGTCWLGYSR